MIYVADLMKKLDDSECSPVNPSRRKLLTIPKSSWSRITFDLNYHIYKPIRRQALEEEDKPKGLQFCSLTRTSSEEQLLDIIFF